MASDHRPRRASAHNVVAVLIAVALVAGAATLFMLNRGKLHQPTPGERLTAALEANLPGTEPAVSFDGETIVIALHVSFDPTTDAESAQTMTQRARTIAGEQAIERKSSIDIQLTGLNVEGQKTSHGQTFDYGVAEDG